MQLIDRSSPVRIGALGMPTSATNCRHESNQGANCLRGRTQWLEQVAAYCRHEVRTAMAGVRSSLFLIQRQTAPADASLRYIEQAARNLDLIEEILEGASNAASLSSAFSIDGAESVSVDHVIAERVQEYAALIYQGKQFEFRRTTRDLEIWGRSEQLVQLVDNLVANAVRHGKPGTAIQIHVGQQDHFAVIEIANAGRELPRAWRTRLKQPLRIDEQDCRSAMQDGIGLFVARLIAEHHGGYLEADNGRAGDLVLLRAKIPRLAMTDGS